jgi:trypsin
MLLCGATLINSRQVLTAAHCVDGKHPSQLTLRGGSKSWERGTHYRVRKIRVHDDWNHRTMQNDIAILDLDRSTDFRTANLPTSPSNIESGTTVRALGWGRTVRGDPNSLSRNLRRADMNVFDMQTCKNKWMGEIPISSRNQFCTGANEFLSTANGDSGGAVLLGDTIVGVISGGGRVPNQYTHPNYQTLVGAYLPWIRANRA